MKWFIAFNRAGNAIADRLGLSGKAKSIYVRRYVNKHLHLHCSYFKIKECEKV